MFGASIYAARIYNAALYTEAGAAPPAAPAGSKGQRVARWLMPMPSIRVPVGEWIHEREDEEILLLG